MQVLITNNNIDFFNGLKKGLKITPSTKNTSVINCTEKTFNTLRQGVRDAGFNPYSVMAW